MRTILLLLITNSLFFKPDILGIYTYCSFDCYRLILSKDSSFILQDVNGEYPIKRISKGRYITIEDTLVLKEESRRFESNVIIDTSNDRLQSYTFEILNNGELKSESFAVLSTREKEYSYFKKE